VGKGAKGGKGADRAKGGDGVNPPIRRPTRPSAPIAGPSAPAVAAATARSAAAKKRDAVRRARTAAAGAGVPHRSRSRVTASRSGGLRPSGTRPGSPRPRPGAAGRGRRRRGFGIGSGRPVWVLGAVGIVLALLILPYFQKWLVQRSELEAARAEVSQTKQDVAALQAQKERWKDDDYVRAQARARLNYVMPGETGYAVADPTPSDQATSTPTITAVPEDDSSWFSRLWVSAQGAGAQDVPQAQSTSTDTP